MQKTQVAGLRVLRGPDWMQGEEDGGEGYLGTVIALLGDGQVQVLWDTGQESTCRAGQVGQHDLRVWDTATVGIKHTGSQCSECGCQDILGTLWRCQQCTGCDLCTLCYHDDRHDLGHPFSRLDTPGGQTYPQQKRKSSVKIRTIGLHPGAKVIRGKHWEWGDQDGGEGSEGEIQGYLKVKNPKSARNLVTVQWSKGVSNSYRLGLDGKVDLKCVEEEVGPFYYRDHLLLLDTTKLSAGSIATPPQTAQNFSSGYVTGEEEIATDVTSEAGTASDVTSEAGTATDVTSGAGTATPAYDDEEELPLAVGDRVAIKVGEDKLKEMQQEWGGCTC